MDGEKVLNVDVLLTIRERDENDTNIKYHKIEYFGHVMHNEKYSILQLKMQGKFSGVHSKGRRRIVE